MKDGISGAIVSLCVLLALHLVVKVGEFLWKMKEKRDSVSDATVDKLTIAVDKMTYSLETLQVRCGTLEKSISDIDKIKTDLRRAFTAVRLLAGEDWTKIRKELDEDSHII